MTIDTFAEHGSEPDDSTLRTAGQWFKVAWHGPDRVIQRVITRPVTGMASSARVTPSATKVSSTAPRRPVPRGQQPVPIAQKSRSNRLPQFIFRRAAQPTGPS
jgi:hypothetical protein